MNSSMNVSYSSRMNASLNTSMSMLNTSRRQGKNAEGYILSSKTEHCLELYGEKLPSIIRSIINNVNITMNSSTSSNEYAKKKISCRMDPNGWACLVSGRKLYVWRYKYNNELTKRPAIACRELELPPSELPHSAQLACVLVNGSPSSMSNTPGCISVSPEGLITYWPNISNESSTVTINADISGGQECDTLSSLWPIGCILCTTTGTVLVVKPVVGGGKKSNLVCIPLNIQKGWLSGLGRKVTTMMFNPISSSNFLEHKKSKVVIPIAKAEPAFPGNKVSNPIFVLNGATLQSWKIFADKQLLTSEANIDDLLRDLFHQKVPELRSQVRADLRGIQIWILDIDVLPSEEIAVLAAALNQSETNENSKKFYFGIMAFNPHKPLRSTGFTLVDYTKSYVEKPEEYLKNWELYSTQKFFYMISPDLLIIIGDTSTDQIEMTSSEGYFIGSGLVNDTTFLTFVPRFGIMLCRNNMNENIMTDYTWTDSRVPDHLALSLTQHNIEDLSLSEDSVNRYKSAFLSYLGKKNNECQCLLNELFPPDIPSLTPNDPIDKFTVALCEKLIDDAPLSDPRWASNYKRDDDEVAKKKAKMLIKNFLYDKKEGIELFFGFLNNTGIRQRLTSVVVNENIVATSSVLYNLYEKVGYAMALQSLQTESNYRSLIDGAIRSIVSHRSHSENQVRSAHLSSNDIFFKDLSRVHQFIQALITIEFDYVSKHESKEVIDYVQLVNEIILRTIDEMLSVCLDDKLEVVQGFLIQNLIDSEDNLYEVHPWILETSTFNSLVQQHELIVDKILTLSDDLSKTSEILQQTSHLTDMILTGLKMNLDSLKRSDRYLEKRRSFEEIRSKLLAIFLKVKDFGGASALAEKYLDFDVLIKICYEDRDFDRLEIYMEKYANYSFAELSFEWFIKKKKGAELIEIFSQNGRVEPILSEFLKKYPQLSWHNSTVNGDFISTSKTLRELADTEETLLDDKKFLMCMSKLAFIAHGGHSRDILTDEFTSTIYNYNHELNLIQYQNEIKEEALNAFGMDKETMRVLTASEQIDLFTYPITEIDVKDFIKALELCNYMINEDIRKEKRILIVARAIRKDVWEEFPTDHPEDVIENSFLHDFLKLAVEKGEDLDNLFDTNEIFKVDILAEVLENDNAKFLLHASYEHFSSEFKREPYEEPLRNTSLYSDALDS